MADTTQTQTALALQTYLDTSASPLGSALQRIPLLNIGIDEEELTTLPLVSEATAIRATHSQGLALTAHIEPDPDRHALVWQMQMAQTEGQAGPRVHHFRPLQIALDRVDDGLKDAVFLQSGPGGPILAAARN